MSAKHSFEGADLCIDGPPKFDLGAVVEDPTVPKTSGESPLTDFEEDPNNPRTDYVGADFDKLVESIRQLGVIVPVTVVKQDTGTLRLVTGHRRFRAAMAAGLTHLRWVVAGESQASLTAQFHENFIRADIEPMDKARKVSELIESGITRQNVAGMLGVDGAVVTRLLALLNLPPYLKSLYDSGKCRQPDYLYHLRKLYDAAPALVERLCSGVEFVDNKVVQQIVVAVESTSDPASSNGKDKAQSKIRPDKGPKAGRRPLAVSRGQFSYKGEPVKVLRMIAKMEDGKERELKGADLHKLMWAAAED